MLTVFSVSLPRAGHHVAEMVLGRLLGARFAYCEYYTILDCCRRIPCARLADRAAGGALLFVQKSHDHDLSDPVGPPGVDGTLVQVREPIARALSNYELDLKTVGPEHSLAYQRLWLGLEAFYFAGFARKWCGEDGGAAAPRRLVLRYEDLVSDPVGYFHRFFEAFALPPALFDPGVVAAAQRVSSADGRQPFRERSISGSPHFDRDGLAEFQRIVAPEAALLGYDPKPELGGGGAAPEVTLAFEARGLAARGEHDAVVAAVDRYLALPAAHPFGRRLRAGALLARGDTAGAEVEYARIAEAEPGHPRAYIDTARLMARRGDAGAARDVLRRCLARSRDRRRAATLIAAEFAGSPLGEVAREDAGAAGGAPAPGGAGPRPAVAAGPPIAREDVVAAFRFILGREPQDERAIEAHRNLGSLAALRAVLLGSPEFATKYRTLREAAPGA